MQAAPSAADARTLERYRDLLRTAPPEAIEQAHAQAIAQLTPEQRQLLLRQVGEMLPPHERALAGPANATPQGIARLIRRAELQRPGVAERILCNLAAALRARGPGAGGVLGAVLLGSVTGTVIGGALAQSPLGEASEAAGSPAAEAEDADADAASSEALPGLGGVSDLDLGGLFDV